MSKPDNHSDPPVEALLNLGPASSARLRSIGIRTRADLERAGAVLAYVALKHRYGDVTANMLYALHGALTGERWNELPPETRADLRTQAAEVTRSTVRSDHKSSGGADE